MAEFGALPPALLPVGLTRLYELQAQLFTPLQGELYLTLPDSFDLPQWDAERLEALSFTIIRTPETMNLGSAILYALGKIGFTDRPLKLLHGDTLLLGLDLGASDVAAVAEGNEGYRWGHVQLRADRSIRAVSPPDDALPSGSLRLCGYFGFSSAARFAEHLAVAGGDFFHALNRQASADRLNEIKPGRWLDFGHVQTFFRSRQIVTTQRSFNSLQITDTHVRKRSTVAADKLRAEARWLRDVPAPLAPFCARLLGSGEDGESYFYDTEYEYMPTLSELYVFGRISGPAWSRILDSCRKFVEASVDAATGAVADNCLRRLVVDKTTDRLTAYARAAGIDLDLPTSLNGRPRPSLRQCLKDITDVLADCGERPSVMHGDFCFSNILYSFRTERVRLIDPRAINENGEFTMLGDCRYDLAKLMHSIAGRYDLIMAGRCAGRRVSSQEFELTFPPDSHRTRSEEIAHATTIAGIRLNSPVVWASTTSLFLSMPPLHSDRPDRQATFIANALRMHAELEKAE